MQKLKNLYNSKRESFIEHCNDRDLVEFYKDWEEMLDMMELEGDEPNTAREQGCLSWLNDAICIVEKESPIKIFQNYKIWKYQFFYDDTQDELKRILEEHIDDSFNWQKLYWVVDWFAHLQDLLDYIS